MKTRKPPHYWTKERCHEIALMYKTRNDFLKKNSNASSAAKRNGWYDDICSHMEKCVRKPLNRWPKERCHEIALSCKTRTEFKENFPCVYEVSRTNGWLNDICTHMEKYVRKPLNKNNKKKRKLWTKELCHQEALKYKTRTEFEKNCRSAYAATNRNNWGGVVFSHMKRFGNKLYRCIYVYEFSDKYAYVGLTCNIEQRDASRKFQPHDPVIKHTKETGLKPQLKQLSEYILVDIACELEIECINFYKEMGWNMLNKHKGGSIGSPKKYWTKEMCHQEALKFNSRSEFYHKNNKVYAAAQRYGWLNDVCSHMKMKFHHWTVEEVKNEALKYKTKKDFNLNNKAAYAWATRHNILDDICSHMISVVGNNQFKKRII